MQSYPWRPKALHFPRGAAPRGSNRRRVDRRIDNRIHSAQQNWAEYFSTATYTGHEVAPRVNRGCAKKGMRCRKRAARYLESTVTAVHGSVSSARISSARQLVSRHEAIRVFTLWQ